MKKIKVIDSHTGGEPTRIIIEGGPELGSGSLPERVSRFRDEFDDIRGAVVNEPRGSDVLVGGLLCEPIDPTCAAGIIFFNNASYLGMCGHGTIGLVVTLKHLGKIDLGRHRFETPVGIVEAELSANGRVSVQNVPAFRYQHDVTVDVPDVGMVTGEIAWGGNWFFLAAAPDETFSVENTDHLLSVTKKIRQALADSNITGPAGEYVDHVELFGPPQDSQNQSRNFVLCPGGAYDRSPCGTGMSAKLACLAASGKLKPGETWRQESIVGSIFKCSYQPDGMIDGRPTIVPTICGEAFVSGESTLLLDPADPFCMGIRP